MPTAEGRALSIQQQYAIEVMAATAGASAEELFRAAYPGMPQVEQEQMAGQYVALIAAAMAAIAATRAGYLQRFAQAEGQAALSIPARLVRPRPADVLVPGLRPEGAVYAGIAKMQAAYEQQIARAAMAEVTESVARMSRVFEQEAAQQARAMAAAQVRSFAEATSIAAADLVDREVLGPTRTVVAFRRVVHPTACPRCVQVAKVLVYKTQPQPRHEQCRCSFEPVYVGDRDYQARLQQYRGNADYVGPSGTYARDRRNRGRAQIQSAEVRQGQYVQRQWREFMADEQTRLARLVQTVKSDTYRDWAVMTSANLAETGGGLLPVITRD